MEISLREYFEKILSAEKESQEKALQIATVEMARRLEALNGEAGRLAKMQETYIPRQVAEPRFEQIEKELKDLVIFKAIAVNKASRDSVTISLLMGAIALILSAINIIMNIMR